MKATGFFSLFLILALFSGCATTAAKRASALSKVVYAEDSAIRAGRFDVAKAYSAQATRLVSPPKKRIVVKPVVSQGKKYVVLPIEFSGTPALAIGSPALNTLVASDRALQGQMRAEDKALAQVTRETDKVITSEAMDAAKQEARPSFWHKFTFFRYSLSLGWIGNCRVRVLPSVDSSLCFSG